MHRPYYCTTDSHALLVQGEPSMYMRLGSKQILRLLQQMRATGQLYEGHLRTFPHVRCEPLECHYQCRRGMDALNAHLFHDLMHCYSWREANWAVWLAALAPRPEWMEQLRDKKAHLPHATLTIELALIAAGDPAPEQLREHVAALNEVRAMLQLLPPAPYPMRSHLSESQKPLFDAEVAAIRSRYQEGGLASAKPLLRQGLVGYYGMTRDEWLRNGAPDSPKSA